MGKEKQDWRSWLADLIGVNPDDRAALMDMLNRLRRRGNVVTEREMAMIQGVLSMRERKIRTVMIPRNDIVSLRIGDDYARAVAVVREWQHSRYPVFDESDDNVIGILLAKDLLGFTGKPEAFDMKTVVREVVREPVSKHLDVLLEDFLSRRNHMVVAVDEHGQTAGIVTIEDLLEQIVGDIKDESDEEEDDATTPLPDNGGHRVKGTMSVEDFNAQFKAALPSGGADNIAGWLAAEFGKLPAAGDCVEKHGFSFRIAKADDRRIYSVIARRTGENS